MKYCEPDSYLVLSEEAEVSVVIQSGGRLLHMNIRVQLHYPGENSLHPGTDYMYVSIIHELSLKGWRKKTKPRDMHMKGAAFVGLSMWVSKRGLREIWIIIDLAWFLFIVMMTTHQHSYRRHSPPCQPHLVLWLNTSSWRMKKLMPRSQTSHCLVSCRVTVCRCIDTHPDISNPVGNITFCNHDNIVYEITYLYTSKDNILGCE